MGTDKGRVIYRPHIPTAEELLQEAISGQCTMMSRFETRPCTDRGTKPVEWCAPCLAEGVMQGRDPADSDGADREMLKDVAREACRRCNGDDPRMCEEVHGDDRRADWCAPCVAFAAIRGHERGKCEACRRPSDTSDSEGVDVCYRCLVEIVQSNLYGALQTIVDELEAGKVEDALARDAVAESGQPSPCNDDEDGVDAAMRTIRERLTLGYAEKPPTVRERLQDLDDDRDTTFKRLDALEAQAKRFGAQVQRVATALQAALHGDHVRAKRFLERFDEV